MCVWLCIHSDVNVIKSNCEVSHLCSETFLQGLSSFSVIKQLTTKHHGKLREKLQKKGKALSLSTGISPLSFEERGLHFHFALKLCSQLWVRGMELASIHGVEWNKTVKISFRRKHWCPRTMTVIAWTCATFNNLFYNL